MGSVGIAHKRHRKGASSKEERTEKPKEDEVYAGSKERGRKTRKKLSGSKEKGGNWREKLFVPKAKAGNWKRKDMPRSDPSNESLLIDELTGYMLSAPPEPFWDLDLTEVLMDPDIVVEMNKVFTDWRELKAGVLKQYHTIGSADLDL